ncbi:zincin [Pseudovirgaria hyperparasitica]|uniref:Zincin n=1 Tax=Pseudovirgaria hyperparasitica TaxID=470096 RepID=A0A6A6W1S9_9PEZI|nr:zincin [Pseudovirgaria hyperparasitica]KAF2755527.1 zincin [Pseudovirgaria hyperparasitica]
MIIQNAFWDGKQMVFGDGDGTIFRDFTSRDDVIGHELTHAVTQFTANLIYENQPGALNESISDVFGIMVKQYKLGKPAAEANWILAEGIWGPGINGRGLRDMQNPGTAYNDPKIGKDPQPAHMKDYKKLPNTADGDYGGVHINSGIPNKAFYLAATKIGGNSWDGAGPIWYETLTGGKLKSNATFQQFADLTVLNAGPHASQVVAAWKEVGISAKSGRSEL